MVVTEEVMVATEAVMEATEAVMERHMGKNHFAIYLQCFFFNIASKI